MKKTTILLMILIITAFSLTQSCTSNGKGEYDEEVTIYLKSIIKNGEYYLEMTDSKGGSAIDTLTTVFKKEAGKPGKIHWEKAQNSGIRKIKKISSEKDTTEIFKAGAKPKIFSSGWKLKLRKDLHVPEDPGYIEEKYTIIYKPEDNPSEVPIDPYIRIEE